MGKPSKIRNCPICRQPYKVYDCYWKRGQMRQCSQKCAQIASRHKSSIVWRGVLYHISNGYYTSSITGKKLHRERWLWHRGEIPIGFVVHHKDGDKLNNALSNLELMEWGAHSSKHNKERHDKKRTSRV